MPLYQYTLIITATHRVKYQVGGSTAMMAVEAGLHGQARGFYVGLADVLNCELEPDTLREIEHEDQVPAYPDGPLQVMAHKVPIRPEEMTSLLAIIEGGGAAISQEIPQDQVRTGEWERTVEHE